jgi:hypothetical protein
MDPPDHFPEIFISRFGIYDLPNAYKDRLFRDKDGIVRPNPSWNPRTDGKLFVQWLPYNEVVGDLEKFKLRFAGKQPGAEIFPP